MRLFKLITTALVLLIIGLFIYQNLEAFKKLVDFSLDLYIREPVTWSLSVSALLFLSGIVGFVLGLLLLLKPYFNTRRLLTQERKDKQQEQTPKKAETAGKEAVQAS